jgi:hypothetical protein
MKWIFSCGCGRGICAHLTHALIARYQSPFPIRIETNLQLAMLAGNSVISQGGKAVSQFVIVPLIFTFGMIFPI